METDELRRASHYSHDPIPTSVDTPFICTTRDPKVEQSHGKRGEGPPHASSSIDVLMQQAFEQRFRQDRGDRTSPIARTTRIEGPTELTTSERQAKLFRNLKDDLLLRIADRKINTEAARDDLRLPMWVWKLSQTSKNVDNSGRTILLEDQR
ncbi:hypothetical protein V8E53_009802 [Lactarius tabidus]